MSAFIRIWGYKEDKKQIYSFYKNLETDQMLKGSWLWHPQLKLEDIATFEEGVCGMSAKPENQGKVFTAWKLKENGSFIQGTFKIKEDELTVEK